MRTNLDQEKYAIYNDIENKLHVAVKKEVVPHIEGIVRKFRRVENVPGDDEHTVKGIYLQNTSANEYNMIDENEVNIKIKNLRFANL
jgi:hypothetical protein